MGANDSTAAKVMNVDFSKAAKLLSRWGWKSSPGALAEFAGVVAPLHGRRVGDIAVAMGFATREELSDALKTKPERTPLIEHMVRVKPTLGPQAQRVLAAHAGVAYYEEYQSQLIHPDFRHDPEIGAACDKASCVLFLTDTAAPVLVFRDYTSLNLYLSMGRAESAADPLRKKYGKSLLVALGTQRLVQQAASQMAGATKTHNDNQRDQVNYWSSSSAESEALRVLGHILDTAVEMGVTDVAIEPVSGGAGVVQYRQHGDLMTVRSETNLSGPMLIEISRFLMTKSRANPQAGRLRDPADGQMIYGAPAGDVFVRCSFIPVDIGMPDFEGVSCALRLLAQSAQRITLQSLNLPAKVIEDIEDAVVLSRGIVLMVGPTGSGKSTTIAGMLDLHVETFGDSKKRLSIEDPIERYLPDIRQFSINEGQKNKDSAFGAAIKAFMRHDPDLIWVGECRDREAAMAATRAANTGHLVLTTFHANDTVIGYKEMSDMLDAGRIINLIEALSLILSQRLVKRLCPKCSTWGAPTPAEHKRFDRYVSRYGIGSIALPEKVKHMRRDGCQVCNNTGVVGRVPVLESLPVTRAVKDVMCDNIAKGSFNYAAIANHRTLSLFDSGIGLVMNGTVELMEIFD